jgi:DNA-binding HxlR family transcriptional regulator
MTGYGQYCPVTRALEVLGDRWTLLILRDIIHDVSRFNALARGLPKLSRGLLAKRLRQLEEAAIVVRVSSTQGETEYRLTEAGKATVPIVEALMVWGATWALEQPMPDELDPVLLMWWMQRRVRTEMLPERRVVAQFDFHQDPDRSYWLVLERRDVSVCFTPPDDEVDVWVAADLSVFYEVWLGRQLYAAAAAGGAITVRSLPAFERAFPSWFAWSPAADAVRAAHRTVVPYSVRTPEARC